MTGISIGAAYTQLSASLINDISCVIALALYDLMFGGTAKLIKKFESSTYMVG